MSLGNVEITKPNQDLISSIELSEEDVQTIDSIIQKAMEASGKSYEDISESAFYFKNMSGNI